jgi:hypothetical protein
LSCTNLKPAMKKIVFLAFVALIFSVTAHSQLMVSKLLGKNSKNSKMGFGAFAFYDFPLNEEETRSIRLELLDFAYFPTKDDNLNAILGYISIKVGYKYVFSETKTGFYLEPQVGYCRTVLDDVNQVDAVTGDGVALALEGGYGIEVGQQGNTINIGVKYEKDLTSSSATTISSIGFRVSYSFGLFKRRN